MMFLHISIEQAATNARVAFKFQFGDRRVPVKSSERFCGMQIYWRTYVQAEFRRTKEREREKRDIKEEKEVTGGETKSKSERLRKIGSESKENDGTKGDLLKNEVVKHSTHIVSSTFPPSSSAFAHIFADAFQSFPLPHLPGGGK